MGTIEKLKKYLSDPPEKFRSAPFWGWNSTLKKEELGEQIKGFKKAGMGGFFIHSREGLETEYLSPEWLEDVKYCVDKAREMGKSADLILYVVDSSTLLDESDEEIIGMLENKKAIVLLNKTDLHPVVDEESLKKKVNHPIIPISVKEQTGIRELEEQIKEMFFSGNITFNDEVYITNARHKEALEEAYQSLELVEQSIEMDMPEDFFSIDLMSAYETLGKILGESVGEDLVNEIFSKFCMGK